MYYLNSRFYDPEIGRFISADNIEIIIASANSLKGKNLYSYCENNPIKKVDSAGTLGIEAGIIVAGGIIGTVMGALSAASTGGNILEGAIEGGLTGVVGSIYGVMGVNPILAGLIGSLVDVGVQVVSYCVNNGTGPMIDRERVIKTGIVMGLGVAIPPFGEFSKSIVDGIGTALVWAEATALITAADIVYTTSKTKTVGNASVVVN